MFSYNRKTGCGNDRYDDAIYCGCANSVFINKDLMKYGKLKLEYAYINEIFSEGNIYKKSDNTSSTIFYLNGNNSNNFGAIVGASVIMENLYSCSYSDRLDATYETYKLYYSDYSDAKLYEMAYETVKDEVIQSVNNNQIRICATADLDENYISYYKEKIIGIDFKNNLNDIYITNDVIDYYDSNVSSMINAEALFYHANNDNKTRSYAYDLMDASTDWSNMDTPYLSNHIVINYLEFESTFTVLKSIFICLFIAFLFIGLFILYKHITDDIAFIEKDFGVLKAIGVRTVDIFRIISILLATISISVIVFSFALQYGVVYLVNEITSKLLDENGILHT